jgi:hypothetical protein
MPWNTFDTAVDIKSLLEKFPLSVVAVLMGVKRPDIRGIR